MALNRDRHVGDSSVLLAYLRSGLMSSYGCGVRVVVDASIEIDVRVIVYV